MSKFISEWRYGALNLLVILLMAVGGPVVITSLCSGLVMLLMSLFGFTLEFFNEHSYHIGILSVIILGPYFIGKDWDKIEEFAKGTKPSSQIDNQKPQDEPSTKINPNYDDRGRELSNSEKWLAIGFAIFCLLALLFK